MKRITFFSSWLVVAAVGCMAAPNTEVATGEVSRGSDDWAADSGAHPQVIRIARAGGRCTGWLSSSNTITTNAHCLANPTDFVGWTYDSTMRNSNPAEFAALRAMGPSIGGFIHPGGSACVNQGSECCVGADMAVLVFAPANAVPRTVMRPLRLIAPQAAEPACSGADTCVMMIGTGRTDPGACMDTSVTNAALDSGATQLFVESGLGDGHCPANGDMLYGEYDFDDSKSCKGDSGSPIIWRATGELMAQGRGTGGDGGDDVVGPVLWTGGPDTARDFYVLRAADQDGDGLQAADDNCDRTWNPTQADFNGDQVGDACQDSDGDGDTDAIELTRGTNPALADSDGDGLRDGDEHARGTNPNNPDSDGDGVPDGDEVWRYGSDPMKADTDDDELLDGYEIEGRTSPTNPDTDHDGLSDGNELLVLHTDPLDPDTDHDGLRDGDELGAAATDPLNPDTDADGLPDGAELDLGTNPHDPDTDGDGVLDGDEDTDGDRLGDGFEVRHGTDPRDKDSDHDSVVDCQDVDWIVDALGRIPPTAFAAMVVPTKLAARLHKAEDRTRLGDLATARTALEGLREGLDGCGAAADGDDWLVDCTSQLELRALMDVVLANM